MPKVVSAVQPEIDSAVIRHNGDRRNAVDCPAVKMGMQVMKPLVRYADDEHGGPRG